MNLSDRPARSGKTPGHAVGADAPASSRDRDETARSAARLSLLTPGLPAEVARRARAAGVALRGDDSRTDSASSTLDANQAALRARLGTPREFAMPAPSARSAAQPFQPPFRVTADGVAVLDQRKFPGSVVEVACRSAAEVAGVIADGLVQGAGSTAAVAAYGLAGAAAQPDRLVETPTAQAAAIEADAQRIVEAAHWLAPLVHAMDRLAARARSWAVSPQARPLAEELHEEADLLATDETIRLVRLVAVGVHLLRGQSTDLGPGKRVRVLLHGDVGSLANGLLGTAAAVVEAAHRIGVPVHVWVAEGRPPLTGVRTAWELRAAGVGHGIVPDSSVGSMLSRHEIDLILVGALGVTADGSVVRESGARAVAELALANAVPMYVCAPSSILDAAHSSRSDRYELTPPELVTGFVTDGGLVRPPFAEGLARALKSPDGEGGASPARQP